MKRIDTSTLGLDQTTLEYAADDLWKELRGIEKYYPYVLENEAYRQLKQKCTAFVYGLPTEDALKGLYGAIVECLRAISVQTTNIASLAAKREGVKLLSDYLPPTFEDFVNKVTEAKLQAEYYENAYDGAAEALFMAELEDGIDAVVPRHREEVRERIYEMLMDDADEEDNAAIDKAGLDKILALMGIKDGIDLLDTAIDQGFQKVAEIILWVRDEIDKEYTESDAAKLGLGKARPEDIEALESGIRRLVSAIAGRENKHGSIKELGKAHRMEFARRITRPSLKAEEDKRPTILEAEKHGLTPLEIKVLLMSGYLKVPSDDEPLKRRDLGASDPVTGRTLGEIEEEALDRIPPTRGIPRGTN